MASELEGLPERVTRVEQKLDLMARSVEQGFTGVSVAIAEQRQYTEFAFEALRSEMNDRFGQVDTRFDVMDSRFDVMDTRFDAMDARFDAMDARFDAMDARFSRLERKVDSLVDRLIDGKRN